MANESPVASVVMAAGRGSRMKAYDGNKTLLPLVPEQSPFEGRYPILVYILRSIPAGPKAVIVNYRSEDVKAATEGMDLQYFHQPELNGTGGALLAAKAFIAEQAGECDRMLITMGDVPFVRAETYRNLLAQLDHHPLAVLGFVPENKRRYGVLETEGDQVKRITEWKYWKDYPEERQQELRICNAGIYAARPDTLAKYLPVLESRPQIVLKERAGKMVEIQEYFLTDIAEYMTEDGLTVGYALTADETETMGVDDPDALERAQQHFRTLAI